MAKDKKKSDPIRARSIQNRDRAREVVANAQDFILELVDPRRVASNVKEAFASPPPNVVGQPTISPDFVTEGEFSSLRPTNDPDPRFKDAAAPELGFDQLMGLVSGAVATAPGGAAPGDTSAFAPRAIPGATEADAQRLVQDTGVLIESELIAQQNPEPKSKDGQPSAKDILQNKIMLDLQGQMEKIDAATIRPDNPLTTTFMDQGMTLEDRIAGAKTTMSSLTASSRKTGLVETIGGAFGVLGGLISAVNPTLGFAINRSGKALASLDPQARDRARGLELAGLISRDLNRSFDLQNEQILRENLTGESLAKSIAIKNAAEFAQDTLSRKNNERVKDLMFKMEELKLTGDQSLATQTELLALESELRIREGEEGTARDLSVMYAKAGVEESAVLLSNAHEFTIRSMQNRFTSGQQALRLSSEELISEANRRQKNEADFEVAPEQFSTLTIQNSKQLLQEYLNNVGPVDEGIVTEIVLQVGLALSQPSGEIFKHPNQELDSELNIAGLNLSPQTNQYPKIIMDLLKEFKIKRAAKKGPSLFDKAVGPISDLHGQLFRGELQNR